MCNLEPTEFNDYLELIKGLETSQNTLFISPILLGSNMGGMGDPGKYTTSDRWH